jgi:signal transduction histidine kinase
LVAGVGWRAGLVGRESAANDPGTYPGYVLMTNGVVVLDELATETRFRVPARLAEHGVVSGVSTVIGSVERPYGVLGAWTTRRRVFTRNDLHFVQAIAHLLGEAVERWLADDEVRRGNAALETRVRERTAELESANRELEAFCRSVSHDLRAPLRGIDGFSLAVIEEYGDRLDATGREYLQRVRAGTQRMGQIIDDLLALSRVLRVEMDRGPVDLSALATRVFDELRETNPKRRVDVVIAPGVVATGDERLLRLAIENLLDNAWKFTARRSGARIEFGVSERDDAPAYFVRDNGAGFDMAYADQLFGVFQRLHRQSEFPGNGVGLATVRRIIERHGGRVWAEGAVEQGATFLFTL